MHLQKVQLVTITENEELQRLDNFLLARLKGVPKSAVYKIIRKGEVRVNKKRCKPLQKLQVGDVVRIPPVKLQEASSPPPPSNQLSKLLANSILFDEGGLLIVNKPSGLAVHGGSGVNLGLIEALRQMPENKGFLELIHRLDRDTSGCVMIARKRSVLKKYQEALRLRHGIQKRYTALVQGSWPKHTSMVDLPLKRFLINNGERIVRVSDDGKPSKTAFKVLQRFQNATLLEASPITGRTHQIRVHALHHGCPLFGDAKYGDTPLNAELTRSTKINRLFLHASALKVTLDDDSRFEVEAPLPLELESALKALTG